jgi:hypothetical protein
MNELLSQLGYFGPMTLFGAIVGLMFHSGIYPVSAFVAVAIWQYGSFFINLGIKNILEIPRPEGTISANAWDEENTKEYGMPSGHAQQAFSELTFIALTFRNKYVTAMASLQTVITLVQRYSFSKHDIPQLVVGGAIGIVIGIAFYIFAKRNYGIPYDRAEQQSYPEKIGDKTGASDENQNDNMRPGRHSDDTLHRRSSNLYR